VRLVVASKILTLDSCHLLIRLFPKRCDFCVF